mmetsp:Transcript_24300/g.33980  ORF Transcript_24300/g.33980 Transcript_24300/m.33980 type:complete len:244 (-) Transcript_24300:76-807(-)|eukprot:CAMPEP_0185264752 /NCGR_PEP_ID=MMETSP1359-20130426/24596_1 /TAXON_ID=552665 /ORGANISM="Bigelowiella longifila, Strain CCMP242" /LENGTH=243 /DNA_ID=CAMNT_0027853529 /DNA_START=23 /DNA_END=754 /DNA_ORIENTATION=+
MDNGFDEKGKRPGQPPVEGRKRKGSSADQLFALLASCSSSVFTVATYLFHRDASWEYRLFASAKILPSSAVDSSEYSGLAAVYGFIQLRPITIYGKIERFGGRLWEFDTTGRNPLVIKEGTPGSILREEYDRLSPTRCLLYGALGVTFASAFAYLYLGYLDERKRALERSSRYMKSLRRRRKRLGISSNKAEKPECVICFANKREIAFAPCGHFMACGTCSHKVKKCPYCSKHIRSRLKIYTV